MNKYITFSPLFICIVVASLSASPEPVTIDVAKPYSYGIFKLPCAIEDDSIGISFSNGIHLFTAHYYSLIPEETEYTCFLLFATSTVSETGFAFNPEIIKVSSPQYTYDTMYATKTVNNPDTIWKESIAYPDSLLPLDSILYTTEEDMYQVNLGNGKWICINEWYNEIYATNGCLEENYNAIMYAKNVLGTSSIKLQVIDGIKSVKERREFPPGTGDSINDLQIDTLLIRWAVDSSGNGIFKYDEMHMSSLENKNKNRRHPEVSERNGSLPLVNFGEDINYTTVKLFSLNGRMLFQAMGSRKRHVLPIVAKGQYVLHVRNTSQVLYNRVILIK